MTTTTDTTKTNDANLVIDKPADRPVDGGPFTEPVTPPTSTAVTTTPPTEPVPQYPTNRPPLANPDFIDPLLLAILCEPRCHDTPNERKFGEWLIKQLNKLKVKPVLRQNGNITVHIGEGKTLFSSHIDTCHAATEQTTYNLVYDKDMEQLFVPKEKLAPNAPKHAIARPVAGCLGADDGAGVWLMLKMIEAKVPGGYVFHRGEEKGGLGSKQMVEKEQEWIKKFTACVAFDRASDFEVIYKQGGVACASATYTDALSKALSWPEMAIKYQGSDRGTFTDSKNYRGLISECVNIGVGYYNQHGPDECLDYGHLYALRDIAVKLDWDALPRTRTPFIAPPTQYSGYGGYGGSSASGKTWSRGYDAEGEFVGYGNGMYDSKWDADDARRTKGGGKDNVSTFPKTPSTTNKTPPPPVKRSSFMYDSHLEELFENIESSDDLIVMHDADPDLFFRSMMRAIVEGRAAEIKAEMLAKKFV